MTSQWQHARTLKNLKSGSESQLRYLNNCMTWNKSLDISEFGFPLFKMGIKMTATT